MVKKLLPVLVAISFLAVLALPIAGLAATPVPQDQCTMKKDVGVTGCPAVGTVCPFNSATIPCGICCTLDVIYSIIDWVFVFLIAITGIFVILGAWEFLSSAGDPTKTKTGKNYIMYAAIGLAVAFLAKAIPAIVRVIIT